MNVCFHENLLILEQNYFEIVLQIESAMTQKPIEII